MRASHKKRITRLMASLPSPDEAERREIEERVSLRFDAKLCAVIRAVMQRRGIVEWMFGSRARKFSDCVMLTAAMSSLMPLRFWMSLARCDPPLVHPKPPPNKRAATKPKRAKVMQFLRSDGGDICYRKCN